MWPRSGSEEPQSIRGGGYWIEPRDQFQLLGVERAWTLAFWNQPKGLGLMVIFPTGRDMSILIADADTPRELPDGYLAEIAYAVIPARNHCVGPVPQDTLLNQQLTRSRHHGWINSRGGTPPLTICVGVIF